MSESVADGFLSDRMRKKQSQDRYKEWCFRREPVRAVWSLLNLNCVQAGQQLLHKQVVDGLAGGDMSCTANRGGTIYRATRMGAIQSLKITGGRQSGTSRSLKTIEPGALRGSRSAVTPHYKTPWLRLEVAA